jgi:hypothetical protein
MDLLNNIIKYDMKLCHIFSKNREDYLSYILQAYQHIQRSNIYFFHNQTQKEIELHKKIALDLFRNIDINIRFPLIINEKINLSFLKGEIYPFYMDVSNEFDKRSVDSHTHNPNVSLNELEYGRITSFPSSVIFYNRINSFGEYWIFMDLSQIYYMQYDLLTKNIIK